ncbi:hypothetical protein [Cellulomonas timonensis]|uniref:hypothetical protein n=1 Tax=Cellulomonas timonensis TaxID=1689271 RepID=UPI0008376667|nr:hypothetical protein [Cellulomonas timonensis]
MATLMYDGREITVDDYSAGQIVAHAMRAGHGGRTEAVLLEGDGATPPLVLTVGAGISLGVVFEGSVPTTVRDAAGLVVQGYNVRADA